MSKLKRLAVPRFWPVERKTKKYSVMPYPGPHPKERCLPVGIILRDILGIAENMKEAKEILNKGLVKVDGKTRREQKFPAGLMDVVSVGDEHYRVLTNKRGLYLHKIESKEALIKLRRIENKHYARKGKLQFSFHDGTNIIAKKDCSTGDVAVINLQDSSIKDVLRLSKNSIALVTAGHNIGNTGKILDIKVTKTPQPNQVVVSLEGRSVSIPKDFVFVIGTDKPVISLGG